MSSVIEKVDLSLYGCPMHYIKARQVVSKLEPGQIVLFDVSNGDATDSVMKSLRQDGQICEIESKQSLTTTIRVIKKYD